MKKSNWWAMFLSFFGMVLLCAPFAVVFGYQWLAFDEPNRKYECKGGSTCWAGETVNMMLASIFGALMVIFAGRLPSVGAAGAMHSRRRPVRSSPRCEFVPACGAPTRAGVHLAREVVDAAVATK
jgi:hypothetical protein